MGRFGNHDGPEARIADLEAQLALTAQALKSQRSSYEEDSASFERTLSRLAQSERSLSQTKARLVDAEALATAEQTRADAAEAREQQALAAARAARFELAANVAELEELQGKLSDLRAEHAELTLRHTESAAERARCEVELDEAMALNESLKRDLDDCQGELAAARERDVEAVHVRATVRPQGMSTSSPKTSRSRSAPEITVDGVKLES